MEYLLVFISVIILNVSVRSQDGLEIAKFDQTTMDLGSVVKGDKVDGEFSFTNISDHDIEIDLVSTCECTEAKWTYGIIKPGGKGKIRFTFDSNEKEKVEPVDIDVFFMNINESTGNHYSVFLQYTFDYQ